MARTRTVSIPPALVRTSNMITSTVASLREEGNPGMAEGLELAHGIILRATIEEAAAPAAGTSPDPADDDGGDE